MPMQHSQPPACVLALAVKTRAALAIVAFDRVAKSSGKGKNDPPRRYHRITRKGKEGNREKEKERERERERERNREGTTHRKRERQRKRQKVAILTCREESHNSNTHTQRERAAHRVFVMCCTGRVRPFPMPPPLAEGAATKNAPGSAPKGKKARRAPACEHRPSAHTPRLACTCKHTHTHIHRCRNSELRDAQVLPRLQQCDDQPLGEEQLQCLSPARGRVVRATRKIEVKPLRP